MDALRHLEHFFSRLLSAKEFWAAIVGALIGGFSAGRYSLRAQKQAAADQRMRDRETQLEVVKGTLQAIDTELDLCKAQFLDAFARRFKEPDPQGSFGHLPSSFL